MLEGFFFLRPPVGVLRRALTVTAAFAIALGIADRATPAVADVFSTSGQNGTYEPSRMTRVGNVLYDYSTGPNVPMMYSTDGSHWASGPAVFPSGAPLSVRRAVAGFDGQLRSPNVIYSRGLYRLYYAAWGRNATSAIAFATSPTLDPTSRAYRWTDRGVVASEVHGSGRLSDPSPFEDRSGNAYLSWSSEALRGVSRVFVARLNGDGMIASAAVAVTVGRVAAPYITQRDGYFYLFTDEIGSGNASDVRVARATSPAGPYLVRATPFLASNAAFQSPYHIGIADVRNTSIFSFAYARGGRSIMGVGSIIWDADGWPYAIQTGVPAARAQTEQTQRRERAASTSTPLSYNDNFDGNAVGSQAAGWMPQSGSWSVCQPPNQSHEYCETNGAGGITLPAIAGQSSWTDYSFVADTYRDATNSNGSAMLLGRVVDSSHFYGLELRPDMAGSGRPYWYLERYDPTHGFTVLTGGPFTTNTVEYYTLRMKFTGTTISAFVAYDFSNQFQALGHAKDATYASGGVGLRTSGNGLGRFDNVSVTSNASGPAPAPTPMPTLVPTTKPTPVATMTPKPTPVPTTAPRPAPTPTPTPRPTATPTSPPGKVSISGIHVSGNTLVNSSGQTIVLHGVDRSGTEYSCVHGDGFFDGPNDQTSVAAIASWHTNAVRVPLNEDCWLGLNGVSSQYAGANYHTAIANYVNLLNANGLVAILDLHWNNSGTSSATGQEPMADSDHGPAFWQSVASTFKSNDSVIFDLYNEPYGISWSCWRDGGSASTCKTPFAISGMNSLISAVRSTGARNVVMAGGLAYSNDLSQWLAYMPTDSAGNLAASWHVYNFNACANTSCWNSQAAPVVARVPLIAGEIGENDCAHGFIDGLMSFLDQHHSSYLGWTWNADFNCNSGPSLITNYNGTPSNFGIGLRDHFASLI